MYRIAFIIFFSCIVSAFCVQELIGQPSEDDGRRRGGGGERPQEQPVPSVADPNTESGEQKTEALTEPAYIPPPPPPANYLVKIVHPDVADVLGLDEKQRTEALRIITVQINDLANAQLNKAPPERYLEIYKDTEDKLRNVLKPTQKALLDQGLELKKIRFNFNKQPWKDVLELIARQANYQLNMLAPPPGTFTYFDREEYTLTQALDLVNGNLYTMGYTLVRQGRMLMLLNLRTPIPNASFPQVQSEELPSRADSEFVSVIFPLERRNKENALKAIEPLKGPFAKIFDTGGTITAIDRVITLKGMQTAINSIENPPAPKQPEPPKPPPPSKWERYTVKENTPEKIMSIFTEYSPNAKIIRLPNSWELHVYAPEPEHTKLKEIFDMLEADAGQMQSEEAAAAGAVVPFAPKNIALETLASIIGDIYPAAKISSDTERGRVVIRVRADQEEPLKSLLKDLDAGDPDKEKRYFDSYPIGSGFATPRSRRIRNADGSPSMDMSRSAPIPFAETLQNLVPGAKISFDEQTQNLIVWGTEEEHAIIKAAVQGLMGEGNDKKIQKFPLHRMEEEDIRPILQRMYPMVETSYAAGNIIAEGHPKLLAKVGELINMLDPEEPSENDPVVRYYFLKTTLTPFMLQGLRQIAPRAKIATDYSNDRIVVIAPPAEQERIRENAEIIAAAYKEPQKVVERFELHRIPWWRVIGIIQRMYPFPTTRVTYDDAWRFLVVETYPEIMIKITDLVATVDPKEPTAVDPVVKFYPLNSDPSGLVLQGLQQLAPLPSVIVPDRKQVMVIATPAVHKIIEENTKLIAETFTGLEDPVLCIYTVTRDERDRLTAFIRVAHADLRDAQIIPERPGERPGTDPAAADAEQPPRRSSAAPSAPSDRLSIWARPAEHDLISTVLKQIKESQANLPDRQLKSFPMSVSDLATAQNLLRAAHPDALLIPDEEGNRLMVYAAAEEMEKITKTLRIQGSIDDRTMIAYTVAGVKSETIVKVITGMYPQLKVTPEPGKVLVWASPEEHVKIGEAVEQANKEVDPESELAEKFVAHSTANIDPAMITQLQELFKSMIPDADVHADPTANKIVVRARARDHARINELFEQLREKDERLRPQLVVYSFGDTDPVMVEAMLRNQLPDAQSMSPWDLVNRLGSTYYYEDMGYTWDAQGNFRRIPPKKVGYFKVDPQARVVHVFVTGELQKEVGEAMKQLFAAGNQEGIKLIVKRYSMSEIDDFYDVRQLIQRIASNALIQAIYERVPSTYTYTSGGTTYTFSDYYWRTTGDFLAYTTEGEHEKIETLMKQLNDQAGTSKKELLTIAIPEQSPYSKEKVVEMIQRMYSDISPMTGGTVNQILVWAPLHRLERIQKMVDEVCKPLPEGERTITKSYPLRFISVESATAWLSALYPNAALNPEKLGTPGQGAEPRSALDSERADKGKFVVVVATPLEQAEIEKTIAELDQDLPDSIKKVPRAYTMNEMPAHMFWSFYTSLHSTFTNATCTPFYEQMTAVVVATEDDHKIIAEFVKNYREDIEHKRPSLQIYALKRLNYYQVSPLIQRIAPTVGIWSGAQPDQISIWGTPKEQSDIAEALAKLETFSEATPSQTLKAYKTGTGKAHTAEWLLRYSFPGAGIAAISPDELLAWASPVDHDTIAAMLKATSEMWPDPQMKTYSFKHVPLHEGTDILQQAFAGQVSSMTPRPSTDDLMVYATPDIHEKIAASIANFDVPRPVGTEALPKTHDLSDLPNLQWIMWTVAPQIREALQGRVQVVQGVTPGQIVVWAKPADHEKVDSMIKQMLAERPAATATTKIYTLQRYANVENVKLAMEHLTPNAKPSPALGGNLNQIVVWAKEADHQKIQSIVDTLNESEPNIVMELHPLKNINYWTARTVLYYVITGQGLDVRWFPDNVGYQFIVLARPEDQKMIAEVLDRIRAEDRDLLTVQLEQTDPYTAQMAINRLFYDDSNAEKPTVEVDPNTNYIFVQGVPKQLERVAKQLRAMGENVWYPAKPEAEGLPGGLQPGVRNIRTLQIRGGADTLRELEKLWNQTQQANPLRVIKDTETPSQYSLEDEIQRGTPNESATEHSELIGPSPVYIVADESGTLTITSADTAALDRLEALLDRLNSGIVYEGRDYTIYSVRNISANVVEARLRIVLQNKLQQQQRTWIDPETGQQTRPAVPQLIIQPDIAANTLIVRGSKSDRMEVGRLIALFDVSELPGERIVRKPITVMIENTEASKVLTDAMRVYQAKINMTQLPGGVRPQIIPNYTKNALEIFAPEPLASELAEYIKEVDQKAVEEGGRKLHVIQLGVKARVVQQAINEVRQAGYAMPYYPYNMPYSPYNNPWRGMQW